MSIRCPLILIFMNREVISSGIDDRRSKITFQSGTLILINWNPKPCLFFKTPKLTQTANYFYFINFMSQYLYNFMWFLRLV